MAAPIIVTASGNGNISLGNVFPTSHANYTNNIAFYLENVTISFASAPTNPGDILVTLDSDEGPGYDVVLAKLDPSATPSIQDFIYIPESPLLCVAGDQIVVTYTQQSSNNIAFAMRIVGRSA